MLKCSECGSPDVRRSHTRGIHEKFLKLLRIVPWRCRCCHHRWFGRSLRPGRQASPDTEKILSQESK